MNVDPKHSIFRPRPTHHPPSLSLSLSQSKIIGFVPIKQAAHDASSDPCENVVEDWTWFTSMAQTILNQPSSQTADCRDGTVGPVATKEDDSARARLERINDKPACSTKRFFIYFFFFFGGFLVVFVKGLCLFILHLLII